MAGKKNGKSKMAWAGALVLIGLLWWQTQIVNTKYKINQFLQPAGSQDVYTVVGIWKVNGVYSYILATPSQIGTVSYPVAAIDGDASWVPVA